MYNKIMTANAHLLQESMVVSVEYISEIYQTIIASWQLVC